MGPSVALLTGRARGPCRTMPVCVCMCVHVCVCVLHFDYYARRGVLGSLICTRTYVGSVRRCVNAVCPWGAVTDLANFSNAVCHCTAVFVLERSGKLQAPADSPLGISWRFEVFVCDPYPDICFGHLGC